MSGQIDYLPLEDALQITGPHKLSDAPNAFSFTRKRDLSSDLGFWDRILASLGIDDTDYEKRRRDRVREIFEKNWGVATDPAQKDIDEHVVELSEVDRPAFRRHPVAIIDGNDRGVYGQQQAVHG